MMFPCRNWVNRCLTMLLYPAFVVFVDGGNRMSASKMNDSFQNGSLVLSMGSTLGWLVSRGVEDRSIHWLMVWYVAWSTDLVWA
jgi:hypothetical protein